MIEWDRPLRQRRGSPTRLGGILLFYDFDWYDHFSDYRAQFRHGQALAHEVQAQCPEGKIPALLLTDRDDAPQGVLSDDDYYIVAINLPRYREQEPNAVASYYAQLTTSPMVRATRVDGASGVRIPGIRNIQMSTDDIHDWAVGDELRIAVLRDALNRLANGVDIDATTIESFLRITGNLTPELVDALGAVFMESEASGARNRLLRAITAHRDGRYAVSRTLAERIDDRLEDAIQASEAFDHLIEDPSTNETRLQQYLESHPWLFGLEYVAVRSRRQIMRGYVDFILERYDGLQDLLELKNPQDPIIEAPDTQDGKPPSASDFALSRSLAKAIAQALVYRDALRDEAASERWFGLTNTRETKVLIVIGRAGQLQSHRRTVLNELNLSLHRIEVIPYDGVSSRARVQIENVKRLWAESNSSTASDGAT